MINRYNAPPSVYVNSFNQFAPNAINNNNGVTSKTNRFLINFS